MKTSWMVWMVLGLSFGLLGCGADEEDDRYEVSTSDLEGSIAGMPFTVASGYAEDKFGDGELWIELFSEAVEDPCDPFAFPSGPSIIISTTPEIKDIDLGFKNNITFAYQDGDTSANDISIQGRLIIEAVDDATLKGGLFAKFEEHEVDGRFEVPVCPPAE